VLAGQVRIKHILSLPTNDNVRDYLVDAEGKLRRRPSLVHRAINETLRNNPEDFSVLNGGIVLVAREVEIDEKDRIVRLVEPSIINGAQTQGVIQDLKAEYELRGQELPDVHVKFEIIVTNDEQVIANTSISRNFQNEVKTLSIVGQLGQLDELEKALQATFPKTKLRKSETDLTDDFLDSEKLLQVITVLIPDELWPVSTEVESPKKSFAYSQKSKCLRDFQLLYKKAHGEIQLSPAEQESANKLYQFYLDIAGEAHSLYSKWKNHQGFQNCGLHEKADGKGLKRDGKIIVDVPDGMIFPILASLATFAQQTINGWRIVPPQLFSDNDIIQAAISQYKESAKSNPQTMGKKAEIYSNLLQITRIFRKLSR
jgi:hypothetical protein